MTLQQVLIYALMCYGIQDNSSKDLDERIPEKCPQITKELKDISEDDIHMHYARVIENEDMFGKLEIGLWTYTVFTQYDHWKGGGRSHDGRRRKCKLVVYDFNIKKIKTKVWAL